MKKYTAVLFIFIFGLLIIPITTKAITYNFGDVTLKNGSRGEAVMELQKFLNATLNLGLVVDGILGPKTITVIKKWQSDNGLVPDGLVGRKTKAMMNSLSQIVPTNNSTITASNITPTPTYECVQKDFTMALIFVGKDLSSSNFEKQRYSDELKYVKNRFPWAFKFATKELATMSIPDDPYFIDSNNIVSVDGNINFELAAKKFYENHTDKYDFLSIFTNVKYPSTDYLHFNIKNNIKNIGLPIFDNTAIYGSAGRLKGINFMNDALDRNGNIRDCYEDQNNNFTTLSIASDCGMAGILHETAHQWAVYVGDIVPGTQIGITGSSPDKNLSIRRDGAHYYSGFDAPTGTIDLLGSGHWEKTSESNSFINNTLDESAISEKYHPFTLYFMGLLPESEYDKKFNIFQNRGTYVLNQNFSLPSMKSVYNQVSVRDIITKEGIRQCAN